MALPFPPSPAAAVALAPDHLERLRSKLEGVKGSRTKYVALCPAHDDDTPSLSVTVGADNRILVKCHKGCSSEAIVRAVGLTMADLFPPSPLAARANGVNGNGHRDAGPLPSTRKLHGDRPTLVKSYDYTDEDGAVLYQACRMALPDGKKTFRQRRPDGIGGWIHDLDGVRLVPYRLPDVIEAAQMGRRIFVVEGEKDADNLRRTGNVATTSPMGAGKWKDEYAAHFKGAEVVILPDNDDPGRAHAATVAASLHAVGCTVRVVPLPGLPEKGDVSDWFELGHDEDELGELIARTRLWTPDPSSRTRWRLDELLANEEIMRPPPPIVPRIAWRNRSTLLAAAEKSGKSTLLGHIAAQVTLGGMFLGERCESGVVLLFGLEEFIGDVGRRMRHFQADPTRTYIVDALSSDASERAAELRAHVEAVKPALTIVDTLMAYGEGAISDAASSAQMQPIVQQLTRLAHELDTALVIVHHARKADGRYRDSSAIGGGVDVLLEMFVPDEDTDPSLRQVRAKGRVPVHGYRMRFTGHDFILDEGAAAPLEQRIITLIRSRPGVTLRDVREGVTGRFDDISKAITQMLAAGQLIDRGEGASRKLYVPGPRPATLPWGGPE